MVRAHAVGRPWTQEEDERLIQAVKIHGDNTEKWKIIAESVPGRTNKACRKRWLHSLCPTVKKTAWTAEEDQQLLSLYQQHSTKWAMIARHIPGRTDDACSKRYREALDPNLKKDEWTEEEDIQLLSCYAEIGGKWGQLGQMLRRSGLACRNRWRLLERKKKAMEKQNKDAEVPVPQELPSVEEPIPLRNPVIWNEPAPPPIMPMMPNPIDVVFPGYQAMLQPMQAPSLLQSPLTIPDQHIMHGAPRPPHFSFESSSLSTALAQPPSRISYARTSSSEHSGQLSEPAQVIQERLSTVPPQNVIYDEPLPEFPLEPPDGAHDYYEDVGPQISSRGTSASPQSPAFAEAASVPPGPEVIDASVASHGDPELVVPNLSGELRTLVPISPRKRKADKAQFSTSPIARIIPSFNGIFQDPPRLSSKLAASSDPSVLAYACGHPDCWNAEQSRSSACFTTSGELSDHHKEFHALAPCGYNDQPFRCGLEGCKKGWKSINGLQYHLQISKAHFQHALQGSSVSVRPQGPTSTRSQPAVSMEIESPKPRKTHQCPYCPNVYKQLSGLRYHLTHGHGPQLSTQLDDLPPTISRQLRGQNRNESP